MSILSTLNKQLGITWYIKNWANCYIFKVKTVNQCNICLKGFGYEMPNFSFTKTVVHNYLF